MRGLLVVGALAWGMGGMAPARNEVPGEAVRAQNAPGWLVWWAEGQKAARQSGKPIFLVFR